MDFTSLITNRRSTRKFTNQLLLPEQVELILKTAQKKKHQPVKAVFIGSGNVATHLSHAMQKEGITIIQIFSRSEANARLLAETLHTQWTTELNEVATDADLYVFSLKDSVLQDIIARMPPNNGLWIHTAGSLPLDIFKGYTERYGVFYPLQTFSRTKAISFRNIPCFIEAYREEDEGILCDIAGRLSDNVQTLSSEKRKYLHLAAVFACNFSNYMYALAEKLLDDQGLPFDVLVPLIDEAAAKIHLLSPAKAQTGPAVRYDQNVIRQQMDLLTRPEMKEIYQLISKNIHKNAIHE